MVLLNYFKYIKERFTLKLYGPLSLTLWAIISYKNQYIDLDVLPMLIINLFLFRLLDDLSDIKKDCIDHPERFLVLQKSHHSFYSLAVSIFFCICLLIYYRYPNVFYFFLIFTLVHTVIIFLLRYKEILAPLATFLSLTKYSFFILLFSNEAKIEAFLTLLFFLFYEWYHNRKP